MKCNSSYINLSRYPPVRLSLVTITEKRNEVKQKVEMKKMYLIKT